MGKVRLGVIGASVFGKDLGLYLQKDPNVESISYFDDYSHLSPIEGCAFLGAVSEIDKHYGKSIDQLIDEGFTPSDARRMQESGALTGRSKKTTN